MKKNSTGSSRRTFLTAAGAALAVQAGMTVEAHTSSLVKGRSFVLVHGAWHGGWCWKHVRAKLEAEGARVFTPTLTGQGERHHLRNAEIDLHTHIKDLTAVLETEELANVVLVGHSFGAYSMIGAAQLLPQKISHLVFLDATLPVPAKAAREFWDPAAMVEVEKNLIDGFRLPSFPPSMFDIPPEDKINTEWAKRRLTDMPYGVFKTPFPAMPEANAKAFGAIRKTFIRCTKGKLDGPRLGFEAAKREGMSLIDLATAHNPMMTAPQELTTLLLKIA